jgi:hypothetical protein
VLELNKIILAAIFVATSAGVAIGENLPRPKDNKELCSFIEAAAADASKSQNVFFTSISGKVDCEAKTYAIALGVPANAVSPNVIEHIVSSWQKGVCERPGWDQLILHGWKISMDLEVDGKRISPTTTATICKK